MERLTVYLDPDELKRVEKYASNYKDISMSMSNAGRVLVLKGLESEEKKRKRKRK